ncbi:MFS general substrate transporter [Phlegmacium glaucopus]|nr:MFS general substrate transporter [Phlegmacium glaucopus]
MDVDSTDHPEELELETLTDSELDPFIDHVQHDVKIPTRKEALTARAQFLALCWSLFLIGWTDGSIGPLLPRIQKFYDVGFGSVSWIFVLGCTGVVLGALANMPLSDRLGLGNMLVLGSLFQIAAFSIQFLELSFPIFVLSFGLGGIGIAFQDASANGFIAILQNDSEYKMGFIHAAYGLGALAAPLSATHFSQLTHWSSHYLVSLSLALSNISILAGVFRFSAQDECLQQAGETMPNKTEEIQHDNKFGQLMKYKSVHFLALFLVVYIGVEVTIGGWIVTFLMIVRGGGPSSGYVSTGFFGGLTLGRVILVEVTKKIGSIYAIYVYTLLAIFFQLIVWLLPSFTGGAISVSIIGILLGPMYPIAMNHTARILPLHLVNGTIGWISACGAAGSALLPFVTGTVASKLGIGSLEPLVLVMMILLGIVWFLVPKEPAG